MVRPTQRAEARMFEKVLVTGAGGLMGSYVVSELAGRAHVSGLDIVRGDKDIPFTIGGVEDYAAVARACAGQDAVVHIAARPNIWSGSGTEIMTTNTIGTWNVLAAAEAAGVKRVIITSSDSVAGFTVFQGAMIPPDYLPIDRDHPRRATDPYGLSKVLGEDIGRSFAWRGKLEVLAIRPVYVLYPEFMGEVRARAADPENYGFTTPKAGGRQPAGGGVMWHYVDPRDVARAFRLALEATYRGFAAYFVSGATTLAPDPTIERLEKRIGGKVLVKQPDVYARNPFAPLYDMAPARDELGYWPEHDIRKALYAA
jgi:nucleoside-diphosphate-sugar epimerase